jgi:5'-3' exoribonuclease 1
MGIPHFFSYIYKNYPKILQQVRNKRSYPDGQNIIPELPIPQIDCYALDLNALIHPVCQKIFQYGEFAPDAIKSKSLLMHKHNNQKPKGNPTAKDAFYELCFVIEGLRRIINPKKKFIIAIDGTAGLSKQTQQRQRRFRTAKEGGDEKQASKIKFDPNCITTGSEFMFQLSKFVHFYIMKQIIGPWKHLEVVFSSEKTPGEGEHKIIQYMMRHPEFSYCIHSPDADLIMLTLPLQVKQIYLLRENIYREVRCKYWLVDISKFKTILLNQLKWGNINHVFHPDLAVLDFIVLCFLLGNDFLPPCLEIANGGIDTLFDVYVKVNSKHGHLVTRESVNKKLQYGINTLVFSKVLSYLAGQEEEILLAKSQRQVNFPDYLLREFIVEEECDEQGELVQPKEPNLEAKEVVPEKHMLVSLKFRAYRKKYNETKFTRSVEKVCQEYYRGLVFVLRYYASEMPDWHWYYPEHYSPLLSDLALYADEFDPDLRFSRNEPLSSLAQLLAVLPPQSADILPASCRMLLTTSSPIADFYPLKFDYILEGKNSDWEGHAKLPFIDVGRLESAFASVKLDIESEKRNMVCRPSRYVMENNQAKCGRD